MDYKIIDREFRDYTAELKYPFSDKATLGSSDGTVVPAGAFIDALLYIPSSVKLPIYLSSMWAAIDADVTYVEFMDSSSEIVATCFIDLNRDNAVLTWLGTEAGSITYDPVIMGQLVHATHGKPISFGTNLPIQTGRCFRYEPTHMLGIKDTYVDDTGGKVHKDDVYIVAASGVHFSTDGPAVNINLLGEDPPKNSPVLSVNGIGRDHLWFAAVPDSGVKVETIPNGIKFRSILDE